MRQPRITLALVLISLASLLVGLTFHTPASAQSGFSAEGDIAAANPTAADAGGVTENQFMFLCEAPPPSQGADGLVYEIPAALAGSVATATGDSPAPYDLDIAFYDADCSFISQSATAAADESTSVPAGTKFVVVNLSIGANVHVCLVVGTATCGAPSSSASASQSASASSSASSSASASTSPSGSASASSSASASASSSPSGGSPSPSQSAGTGHIGTSIRSTRTTVAYNKPFVLSGEVQADASCERPYSISVSKTVGGSNKTTTVDARVPVTKQGTWQLRHKSKVSATYSATASSSTCESEAAATTDVLARVKITFKAVAPCRAPHRVQGLVRPKYPKTKVRLGQKKGGGKFKTIGTDKLDKKSRYVFKTPSCKGRFRVVWPSQSPRNAKGTRPFHF